jgi:hypothetical protein
VNLLPGDGSEGTFDPCPGFTAGQSTSPSACCGEPGKSLGPELAPLLILVGLWLFVEGVWLGKLNAIFWIGPFLIIAGGLWFASDWI